MAFRMSNIRSDDARLLGRATTYLLDNPDPGVRMRPEEQVRLAVDTGLGLVLTRGEEICGLSLIYKFEVAEPAAIYSEIGTMRVTANGFGLQEMFASLHLLQIRLEEYDGSLPLVFAVVSPDTASAHNLQERVGMLPRPPPLELAEVRGKVGVPFSSAKRVLWASEETFSRAAEKLRSWFDGGNAFRTPKNGEVVEADLGWLTPAAIAAEI